MSRDPEQRLCESWSIGRLRPWLQTVAERELPDRLRGRVDASDIVQQTLLKAWQAEANFEGDTREAQLAWLRTILKNTIRDHHRRLFGTDKRGLEQPITSQSNYKPASPGLPIDQLALAREPTASAVVAADEQRRQLQTLLEQLSLEHRQVIELRHFEELSFAQIAARMNRTDPAVRMLWVRALRNLQQLAKSNA